MLKIKNLSDFFYQYTTLLLHVKALFLQEMHYNQELSLN
jgi:hypothetical protein